VESTDTQSVKHGLKTTCSYWSSWYRVSIRCKEERYLWPR